MTQVQSIEKDYDTLKLVEKRLKLLVGAKWEDRSKILKAVEEQKEIRRRFSEKCKGWDSTAEIRRWRDTR